MRAAFRLEGAQDMERTLASLPAGTARGVARRAMRKELRPVKETAEAFWPGAGEAFRISSRIKGSQMGDSEMVRGPSIANMFVGSFEPHAHLIEFGTGPRYHKSGKFTGSVSPQAMLQPAWDMNKDRVLRGLGERLFDEITKTLARRAARG